MRKLILNFFLPIKKLNIEGSGYKESVQTSMSLCGDCPPFAQALLTKKPHEVGPPHVWRRKNGQNAYANSEPTSLLSPSFFKYF
jgi:hypothetical protein